MCKLGWDKGSHRRGESQCQAVKSSISIARASRQTGALSGAFQKVPPDGNELIGPSNATLSTNIAPRGLACPPDKTVKTCCCQGDKKKTQMKLNLVPAPGVQAHHLRPGVGQQSSAWKLLNAAIFPFSWYYFV